MLKTFKKALSKESGALAQPSTRTWTPRRRGMLECDHPRVRNPKTGTVVHAFCICGKHLPPSIPFRTKGQSDDLTKKIREFVRDMLDERFSREHQGRRHQEEIEEDYWPFDENERLPRELDFPFPEEGIHQPSEELPGPAPAGTSDGGHTGSQSEKERSVVVDVVATYKDMKSPGLIEFYMGNVLFDFWFHVVRLSGTGKYSLTVTKVEKLAELYLHSVLYHELFHYFCDVQSYVSGDRSRRAAAGRGGYRSSPTEEPLAVAFSRWRVGEEHRISTYVEAFVDSSFNYEKLPWYRDWVNFKGDVVLTKGIYDYVPYDDMNALRAKGVDAPGLLFRSIDAVIEEPNVAMILWWPDPNSSARGGGTYP